MNLSTILLKHLLIFSAFGSATVIPLMYSQLSPLSRGGQSNDSKIYDKELPDEKLSKKQRELRNTYLSSVSTRLKKDSNLSTTMNSLKIEETDIMSIKNKDDESIVLPTDRTEQEKLNLEVEHDLESSYQGLVSYEKFRDLWGTKAFREENNIPLRGGENMTILDAWEKFFKNTQLDKREVGSSFFLKNGMGNLPFWNYDFPYIAVEFPKGLQLPREFMDGTLDSGWMQVNVTSLENEDRVGSVHLKGLKEAASSFAKILNSEGHERDKHIRNKTLNKIMQPSKDADLYLVSAPEKLLRFWLGDWGNLTSKGIQGNKYALFEQNHYDKTEDHPEVTILRRWWNGRSYRMWIHHKELKTDVIDINQREFTVSKDSNVQDKKFKLNLKWSRDFLLNLLIWYAYTYKLGSDSLPYSLTKEVGGWNLGNIYRENHETNYEDFSKWVRDWYSGAGRSEWVYWWNLAILRGRAFNRTERINWVGEMMDSLSKNWGKPAEISRVVS